MKKLLFLLSLAFVTLGADAQVLPGLHSYTLCAAPSQCTYTHTLTNTAVDTVGTDSNPYRNSVGFQHTVTKTSGNPALSYVITWGSKSATQTGPYYPIATDTIRNVSGPQTFNHDIGPCGVGNPFRWYMTTCQGAGTAVWTFISTYFVR